MQRIFKKDLTRFMQSLSRERQNRASKRKALLAGCSFGWCDTNCVGKLVNSTMFVSKLFNKKCEI